MINNTTAITNLETQVGGNTTAITNLSIAISNGAIGPVQYSDPGSPDRPQWRHPDQRRDPGRRCTRRRSACTMSPMG